MVANAGRINFYGPQAVFIRMRGIHGAAILILVANAYFLTATTLGALIQYVLAAIVLIHDLDENRFAIGAFRQIQEKSGELARLNDSLEKQVEERTQELNEKNIELVEAMERLKATQAQLVESEKMAALSQMVAGVSHEINTPVGNAVTAASHLDQRRKAFAEKYQKGEMKRSDLEGFLDTLAQGVGMVLFNLGRAHELIQSFKKVAVNQSNEVQERFNVRAYLDDVLNSLRPTLKKRPVEVEVTGATELEIKNYPGALSQVATNLIMNSLTHAFEDDQAGHIRIDLEDGDDAVLLTYTDDGAGIPTDIQSKIFDPFFTTKRGKGGSGLGMHIVWNLVTQRMGGDIRLESQPGHGTAFYISIPKEIMEEAA